LYAAKGILKSSPGRRRSLREVRERQSETIPGGGIDAQRSSTVPRRGQDSETTPPGAQALLVSEKVASGAIADDAEELAKYQGLLKRTNAFNDFVEKAIA
jgi:hypothetical protein